MNVSMSNVIDPCDAVRDKLAAIIKKILNGKSESTTAINGLTLHCATTESEASSYLFEPSFAFIAKGSKRVIVGDETYIYDEKNFLLTAVGLPTVVQVLNASESDPYYSLKLDINIDLTTSLIAEVDQHVSTMHSNDTGMSLGIVTLDLANTTLRLLELLENPEDIPILAKSLERELMYRLLKTSVGDRLRESVRLESKTNRINVAIRWLRDNFSLPLDINTLAGTANMAVSTFYQQFRVLTAMSPLQYQKQLRLHEARRLLLSAEIDVGSVSSLVGYESVTQFNREYRRQFGSPPLRDINSIRKSKK